MGHWKFTMNRKIYYWKLRTTALQLGERTLVMGVLNITPDSFSDGGRYLDPDQAYPALLQQKRRCAAWFGASISLRMTASFGWAFCDRLRGKYD